jgi:hypothetical protein
MSIVSIKSKRCIFKDEPAREIISIRCIFRRNNSSFKGPWLFAHPDYESPLRSVVLYIQDNNSTKELLRVGEIYSEKVYKDKIKTIKYATKKIKKYMKMLSKLKNEMITEDSF